MDVQAWSGQATQLQVAAPEDPATAMPAAATLWGLAWNKAASDRPKKF